jgi:hypothetical protein
VVSEQNKSHQQLIISSIVFTAKQELDIEEYSFSQTTLEQVFLKFAHYDEDHANIV